GQQQHGCDFKGKQILGEQDVAQLLHKAHVVLHGGSGQLVHAFQRGHQDEQQQSTGNGGGDLQHVAFVRLGFLVQVQQHDHVEEQHHDGAGIHDDVHDKKKLRVQQQVVAANGKKSNDEVQHAVHRAFREHHQQGGENGDERKKIEKVKCHCDL